MFGSMIHRLNLVLPHLRTHERSKQVEPGSLKKDVLQSKLQFQSDLRCTAYLAERSNQVTEDSNLR